MKKILALLLLFASIGARAQVITATLTVTNGTAVGNTITVNGVFRLWTNTVVNAQYNILTNATISGATSNLFVDYAVAQQPQTVIANTATNIVTFQSYNGYPMVISLGGSWATVTYSTNSTTNSFYFRGPFGVAGTYEATRIESAIVSYLNDTLGSGAVSGSSIYFINFGSLSGNNNWTGSNSFKNITTTNEGLTSPSLTNGVNYGNAFSSPGSGFGSEQFGNGATANNSAAFAAGPNTTASGASSLASGNLATASGINSTAVGANSSSTGAQSSAFGRNASAADLNSLAAGYASSSTAPNSTAIGTSAAATGTNSTAVGQGSTASATGASAFGSGATTSGAGSISLGTGATESATNAIAIGNNVNNSTANEITIGGSGQYMRSSGDLVVSGVIRSNATFTGTIQTGGTNIMYGLMVFQPTTASSLTSGGNQDVPTSTNTYVYLSGPTGAFTVYGLAGGYGNRQVTLVDIAGQVCSLSHLSGSESTATNRIFLGAGHSTSDLLPFTNAATLWYDATSNYWRLITLQ